MKNYTINLYGKEIIITQNDDGTFNKPQEILDYVGIGTATKPAHEPICMARKPLAEKTVAENVLKYGTGGINIEQSRVGMSQDDADMLEAKSSKEFVGVKPFGNTEIKGSALKPNTMGRFPANLIWSCNEDEYEYNGNEENLLEIIKILGEKTTQSA